MAGRGGVGPAGPCNMKEVLGRRGCSELGRNTDARTQRARSAGGTFQEASRLGSQMQSVRLGLKGTSAHRRRIGEVGSGGGMLWQRTGTMASGNGNGGLRIVNTLRRSVRDERATANWS